MDPPPTFATVDEAFDYAEQQDWYGRAALVIAKTAPGPAGRYVPVLMSPSWAPRHQGRVPDHVRPV